jgi:hypothetical protein
VACLQPTDTALAFEGCGEWLVAGLHVLGLAVEDAEAMVSRAFGCTPGEVPAGREALTVRVCRSCVQDCGAPFPEPALAVVGGPVPAVRQPE